ncbi:hypothetical protein JTB14_034975 [Gonioctena quinquepunctata]|nr:hypothetical protein JTB14_034975 [Gonioctena quinquepunctata]
MEASIGLFLTWLADMANAACCVYTSKEPKKFEEPWKNVKKPTFQQKQKCPETVPSTNTEEIESFWLDGPDFLKDPVDLWPEEIKNCPEWEQIDKELNELKKEFTGTCTAEYESGLPNIKRFSKWLRLIRATAWELRFIENLKKFKNKVSHPLKQTLSIMELEEAEKRWIEREF